MRSAASGQKARLGHFLPLASVSAASGTRTRTTVSGQGILSPSCLPIPPLRRGLQVAKVRLIPEIAKLFIIYLGLNAKKHQPLEQTDDWC